ncbi:MAG TPA: lipopolysaccharide biosynthesis protein [Mucilaginibacter sp.]|nr:lipopolysaccharide biosynthesis protein [Mucilaginibacter sp.]
MLNNIKTKFENYFSRGHERTIKAKKNIAITFLLKGFSIIIGLILVPLTINYVNATQYGVWLTLSSIISWFNYFDLGLGNGLKNKLAETHALEQHNKSVVYVSTTYAILSLISASVFVIFLIANHFINWARILNSSTDDLNKLSLIIFGFFCVQFVTQIINTVLTAFHKPSKVSLINLIGQIMVAVVIYILTRSTTGSLVKLAIVLAGIPVLVQLFAGIWYYKTEYKIVAPRFSAIDFAQAGDLLKLGGIFFIIQIGALILFQTDNIVITQLFGPKQVTVFNIAYKFFSVNTMAFTLILIPFWSAYTDAYTKNDFGWIRNSLKKTQKMWMMFSIVSILMLICSSYAYRLWLSGTIQVPYAISFAMMLYAIGYNWISLLCYLLNGIGKIRIQLYIYIFSIFVNIPLAIFLGKFFGVAGVTLSNVIIFVIMGAVLWIQSIKVLNKSAIGVWNK